MFTVNWVRNSVNGCRARLACYNERHSKKLYIWTPHSFGWGQGEINTNKYHLNNNSIHFNIWHAQIFTALWMSHSLIPSASAECDNSLPFSGASSIPLCYVLFPATLLYQLFFHPPSPHLAIYFLVYLSILLFPNSYIILFWEFYLLPFSVHAQTNVIYLMSHPPSNIYIYIYIKTQK